MSHWSLFSDSNMDYAMFTGKSAGAEKYMRITG